MKIKSLLLRTLLMATLLATAACSSDSGYIPEGQSKVTDLGPAGFKIVGKFGYDGTITAPESNLRKYPNQEVYFENILGRKLPNGFYEVSIATANKNRLRGVNIQYSMHWYDEGGIEIHPENAVWSTLTLQASESSSLRGVSPSRDVSSVTVFVRKITYTK